MNNLLLLKIEYDDICRIVIDRNQAFIDDANFRNVTFLCGRAGVCAVGAVAAKYGGDDKLSDFYLSRFKEVGTPS